MPGGQLLKYDGKTFTAPGTGAPLSEDDCRRHFRHVLRGLEYRASSPAQRRVCNPQQPFTYLLLTRPCPAYCYSLLQCTPSASHTAISSPRMCWWHPGAPSCRTLAAPTSSARQRTCWLSRMRTASSLWQRVVARGKRPVARAVWCAILLGRPRSWPQSATLVRAASAAGVGSGAPPVPLNAMIGRC